VADRGHHLLHRETQEIHHRRALGVNPW
jgi:hypothetical protein